MLERMYLRYAERKGFKAEVLDETRGEVAGIKGATIKLSAITPTACCAPKPACTAWCASRRSIPTRAGTPRSPACSSIRKSTTHRGRGQSGRSARRRVSRVRRGRPARQQDRIGGAHHAPADRHRRAEPERSQPAPQSRRGDGDAEVEAVRARAAQAQAQEKALEDSKTDIGWGHQIRSYVLDQSRIKDLRTNVEVGNTQAVLDGDLDDFIEASLKQGVLNGTPLCFDDPDCRFACITALRFLTLDLRLLGSTAHRGGCRATDMAMLTRER